MSGAYGDREVEMGSIDRGGGRDSDSVTDDEDSGAGDRGSRRALRFEENGPAHHAPKRHHTLTARLASQNNEKSLRRRQEMAPKRSVTSTLQLIKDADPKGDDASWFNYHRFYQWICVPYSDRWLPWPSKHTMRKTLNRLDPNAFNPWELLHDYYRPYWSKFGMLITLGCLALLVIYSIFAVQDAIDDERQQEDAFRRLGDSLEQLPYLTGFTFLDASGTPFYNSSYFTVVYKTRFKVNGVSSNAYPDIVHGAEACIIDDIPSLCANETLYIQGLFPDDIFRYTQMEVLKCDPSSSSCVADNVIEAKLEGGTFMFRSEMSLPDGPPPPNLMDDPSFNTAIEWPYRSGYTSHPDIFFGKVTNKFPSKVLRDTRYVRYIQFDHEETFVSDYDSTDRRLFRFFYRMDASHRVSTFVGTTILDTGASIGGIFMLCYVLITVFSQYFVKTAFLQQRKFIVNPDVVRTLIIKKEEELRRFKDHLVMMRAYDALRIEPSELYHYLNSKRDAELTTYKYTLFNALNTKHTAETLRPEWNASFAPKKEKVPEALKQKRLDELQDLERVDQVHRIEDPELAKMLNVLAIQELRRQSDVMQEFVATLRSS